MFRKKKWRIEAGKEAKGRRRERGEKMASIQGDVGYISPEQHLTRGMVHCLKGA